MINLLSNAIKFSNEEDVILIEVTVEVKSTPEDESVVVCVRVKDTGIGISPEDIKKLFQPYFKTTDEINRLMNKGSHGLGLNICQKIVAGMDG